MVIPERGTPDLLERALDHLGPALAGIAEPSEIIVIVNGAPPELYADLRARFPDVRWRFHKMPLGFNGALACGLAATRFGGVYLHNSDMALAADALTALLPWRASQVFAIASQIFFDDPGKRREETGWGDLRLQAGRAQAFERTPDPDGLVRSGLYASGGSSLYDTALLRRFSADTQGYAPFYWEDTDWGLQAWRHGLEVLFHPRSVAWHRHRGTIARFYTAGEIDRIVARNATLFELRNFRETLPARRYAEGSDWATLKELATRVSLAEIRRVRAARRRACFPDIDPERTTRRIYARPAAPDGRPLVLVVSPFCILPPRHGGAWRTWRLCEALSQRWRFILLSDEELAYGPASWDHIGPFDSVHLVGGRPNSPADRIGRIRTHSHGKLQAELDYIAAVHKPELVQLEHIELSGLRPPPVIPSIMVAHDVLISSDGHEQADRFERERLATFDAVIACSDEDAALLAPLPVSVVPNGAVIKRHCRRPSTGNHDLLFAGPFRYAPNLQGVRTFLASVFPELRRRFPALNLSILAGEGGRAIVAGDPLLDQPGVRVMDAVDDVHPWLDLCALTINPLTGTRGSSVKLIESLAAGRVCVSTRDGARGFLGTELPGLLVTEDIAGMLAPITRMLADEPARLALERPEIDALRSISWDSAALRQEKVYRGLLEREKQAP